MKHQERQTMSVAQQVQVSDNTSRDEAGIVLSKYFYTLYKVMRQFASGNTTVQINKVIWC